MKQFFKRLRMPSGSGQRKRTWAMVLLTALLVVAVSATSVFGFLKMTGGHAAVDTLTPETAAGLSVTDSAVVNRMPYSVYVRAAVTVTWQDSSGNIYHAIPAEGTDYSITPQTGWQKFGEYYYYTVPLISGDSAVLPVDFDPLVTSGAYTPDCEVFYQSVQALGTTDDGNIPAVTDLWGVAVNAGGTITGLAS